MRVSLIMRALFLLYFLLLIFISNFRKVLMKLYLLRRCDSTEMSQISFRLSNSLSVVHFEHFYWAAKKNFILLLVLWERKRDILETNAPIALLGAHWPQQKLFLNNNASSQSPFVRIGVPLRCAKTLVKPLLLNREHPDK